MRKFPFAALAVPALAFAAPAAKAVPVTTGKATKAKKSGKVVQVKGKKAAPTK